MQKTTNYELLKPDPESDNVDITVINGNMDTIDSVLKSKAALANPVFTGTPKAPTPSTSDNSTQVATTAFVMSAIAALIGSAPMLLNTLQEIDAAINNDPNLYNDIMTAINNSLSSSESYTNGIIGALSSLSTTSKSNLVAALNEVLSDLTLHEVDDTKHTGYAITSNSGNSYSVTIPNLTALTDGLMIRVKFNAASTGVITINPNGLGDKNIIDYFQNLVTNVKQGLIANLAYEAASGNFILLGKGGGGNATEAQLLSGSTATVDNGPITGIMTNRAGTKFQICGYEGITEIIPHPQAPNNQGLITGQNLYGQTGYIDSNSQIQMSVNNLVPANIAAGVSIGKYQGNGTQEMMGTFTSDATAQAGHILSGEIAYVNGNRVTGTLPNQLEPVTTNTVVWNNNGTIQIGLRIPNGAYLQNYPSAGLSEVQTIENNLVASNIISGKSIFGVAGSATIESLGGRKYASGTAGYAGTGTFTYSNRSTGSWGYVTVSGLIFTPSIIILKYYNSSSGYEVVTIYDTIGGLYPNQVKMACYYGALNGSNNTVNIKADVSPAYVNSNGFCLPIFYNGQHTWEAWE